MIRPILFILEAVRDGDAVLPTPDMLYLYEKNTKHGPENWKNIGEAILV